MRVYAFACVWRARNVEIDKVPPEPSRRRCGLARPSARRARMGWCAMRAGEESRQHWINVVDGEPRRSRRRSVAMRASGQRLASATSFSSSSSCHPFAVAPGPGPLQARGVHQVSLPCRDRHLVCARRPTRQLDVTMRHLRAPQRLLLGQLPPPPPQPSWRPWRATRRERCIESERR